MATRQHIVDFILEQIAGAKEVSARKMFGEYAIYSTGKVVALVCDDQLFVKPTDAGRAFVGAVTEGEPYPGAKPCFVIGGDRWEDGDWLSQLIRLTASALPAPKPKSARRTAPSRTAAKGPPKAKSLPKAKAPPKTRPTAKPKARRKVKAKSRAR